MSFKVIWHTFLRDLKRIFINPVAAGVFICLMIIPCFYAWACIIANWDPYENVKNVKVAIVNEDQTAHNDLAGDLSLGDMIVDNLKDNKQLNWQFTDREEALNNLDVGNCYAVIVVPENFSKSISDIFSDTETKEYAKCEYYVNERQHPVAVKVTDTASSTLETQINQKFAETVTTVVAQKVGEFTGNTVNEAKTVADSIASRIGRVSGTLNDFNSTIDSLDNVSVNTKKTLNETRNLLIDIDNECNNVIYITKDAQSKCEKARAEVIKLIDEIKDIEVLKKVLQDLLETLDDSINSISKINSTINEVKGVIGNAVLLVDQTNKVLETTNGQDKYLKESLESISKQLDDASVQIAAVTSGAKASIFTALLNFDTNSLAKFMASPVQLVTEVINPVPKYGTGIAPFFSNLAFWIGGFCLIALVHTEVKNLKKRKLSYKEGYLARGLLFSLAGLGIGLICTIGDLVIGCEVANPVLFVLTGMFSAFVFVNIIYMLSACFKHLGKAFAVILIILQIPGSNGMLPVQMLPETFQVLHPFLPFSYSIDALRECIVSFNFGYWLLNISVLAFIWFLTILIGMNAGPKLANLNSLFEKKLHKTDIIECEHKDHKKDEQSSIDEIVDSIKPEHADKYKIRAKRGAYAMAFVPQAFLAIMSIIFVFVEVDINFKAICVLIWILMLIVIAINIIIAEFAHARLKAAQNA